MLFYRALQYPFRGEGSLRRVLLLALIQLIPLIGQLILVGYGFDVVRAVYAEQNGLPPICWQPALLNGLRLFLAGLGHIFPLIITIGLIGASTSGSGTLSFVGLLLSIGLPVTLFVLGALFVKRPAGQQPQPRGERLRSALGGFFALLLNVLAVFVINALVDNSGIATGKPNGLSILLFLVLFLLLFAIENVLFIGGVRYAIAKKGLIAPMANARLLVQNRAAVGMFLLNVFLVQLIGLIAIVTGLILLILPGLFVFVVCSLALWYMFAWHAIRVGIEKPGSASARETVPVLQG